MAQPTTKKCRCGRGRILTGRRSIFNGKDSEGRQACATCVMDVIMDRVKKKE